MTNPTFSNSTKLILDAATQMAKQHHHTEITEHHLILTFFEADPKPFLNLSKPLNLNPSTLINELRNKLDTLPTYAHNSQEPALSKKLQNQVHAAFEISKKWGDDTIDSCHFFYIFWQNASSPFLEWKENSGITDEEIKKNIEKCESKNRMTMEKKEEGTSCIEKYCVNLTSQAKEGKLDPVIGRDEEIRRTIQVLLRRTKNNPLLIGEPGVGKTAIAEGLANRILQEDIPESLKGKELLSLDMGSLVAGAKMRGEFEERLKGILKEVEDGNGHYLLFIDEVHTLVGAGATDGAMDAANLLKPSLSKGTLHCIGATTVAEYKKYIEKDAALERRFQTVFIEEPSVEDAIAILRGLKSRYEGFHGVRISDGALCSAATLSDRYISDRQLPDKGIDLIDEAASLIRMQVGSRPLPIDKKERELASLIVKRESLKHDRSPTSKGAIKGLNQEIKALETSLNQLKAQWDKEKKILENLKEKKNDLQKFYFQEEEAERCADFNRVAELRYSMIPNLKKEIEYEEGKINQETNRLLQEEVDEELIATIVGKWTKIPVNKLLKEEADRLLSLETLLQSKVIGQEIAVSAISKAIRRSRAGLNDPNRPMGAFLFIGPTGVGKTELAKALAEELFNKKEALIRLDMSEYMEKHSVAKLIGAPPGYVGHEEGGQLTEAIRRSPYSVILLDEVEKAHQDVFNLLLQIFDDGHISDSKGRTVNCKQALFILTSNLGSDRLLSQKEIPTTKEAILSILEPAIQGYFRPEFINRLDEILPFLPLQKEEIKSILRIQLRNIEKRLEAKEITVQWTDPLLLYLSDKGYDPAFGARPLKRLIQETVVDLLSEAMIKGEIENHANIAVDFYENSVIYQRLEPSDDTSTLVKQVSQDDSDTER